LIKQRGLQAEGEAQFSLVISDDVQQQGLGTELLRRLVEVARAEGLRRLSAETLPDNIGIQATGRKAGFRIEPTADGQRVSLAREV
jgi:acetyltransferase